MSRRQREDPFGELYGEFRDRLRGDRWQPDVDVFETEKDIVVRVELAGVRGGDLRVTVDGDLLRITGVRVALEPADLRRLHQMEIATGPFERRVQIAIPFERAAVTAHLADGFLTVTLPKRQRISRRVDVQAGTDE